MDWIELNTKHRVVCCRLALKGGYSIYFCSFYILIIYLNEVPVVQGKAHLIFFFHSQFCYILGSLFPFYPFTYFTVGMIRLD